MDAFGAAYFIFNITTVPNTKTKKTDSKFISYEHLDKIGEIPIYYGFTPMKSPSIVKADLDTAKEILEGDYVDDETERHGRLPLHVEEKIALLRMYQEQDMQSLQQPVMIYFKDPCRGARKHGGYHRYADLEIVSHSKLRLTAIAVSRAEEIPAHLAADTEVVGVDEAQFFDRHLVTVVQTLADQGRRVLLAGLDQDFRGLPFEPLPELMAVAESVTKCLAICTVCGNPAGRSQRLSREASLVVVGAAEAYEARCRRCHTFGTGT